MDAATRNRIEAIGRSLLRRALNPLAAWQAMLRHIAGPEPSAGHAAAYVFFLQLERRHDRQDLDVGLHRHWLDPTVPFAATLAAPAHGLVVTSATLRDAGMEADRKPPGKQQRRGWAHRICRTRRSAPRWPRRSTMRRRPGR